MLTASYMNLMDARQNDGCGSAQTTRAHQAGQLPQEPGRYAGREIRWRTLTRTGALSGWIPCRSTSPRPQGPSTSSCSASCSPTPPGMHEVQAGDGAHPSAAGYSVLADLLATLEYLDHGRLTNDEDLPPFVTISIQPGP